MNTRILERIGSNVKVRHIDGKTVVLAKVIKSEPLKVEYKFQGMTYGLENPIIIE
jgi:hypothetical protein